MRKFFLALIVLSISFKASVCVAKNIFAKDTRSRELKYQYNVLKEDEKNKRDGKILNLFPSGYMTVEEYEKKSEYKDKSNLDVVIPKINTPSDFKYVPKPLYKLVRYNDPPGSVELSLGKKIYTTKQINAQGIVSPDFTKLAYPAIYYYSDSASVSTDMFVIPLDDGDTNLNKVLKANVAKRNPEPILSTDKVIDNYAAFRSLTPVDFSADGTKLLIKEKIGSSEDGIWKTIPFVYDFNNKTDYDLSAVRVAIVYFWKEYMNLELDDVRWDVYPLGFSQDFPDRILVQAFAFTGNIPVFLGTWSIDWQGNQSRLISFDKNYLPQISINGFKVVKDGVEAYQTVISQEKYLKKETKYLQKEASKQIKDEIKNINVDYKSAVKELKDGYKDEYRDLKKLRALSGSTEGEELQKAYEQYLVEQWSKDIEKTNKQIEKQQKKINKIDEKLNKLYQNSGQTSATENDNNTSETNATDEGI